MFYTFPLNPFLLEYNIPHRSMLDLMPSSSSSSKSKSPSLNTAHIKDDTSISSINKLSLSDSISVAALKEWAMICKAIEDGKQVLLFRKGGIMEYRNGFELKHKVFFLFPTFEHQSLDSIQKEYGKELECLQNQQQQQQHQKQYNSQKDRDVHTEENNALKNTIKINLIVEITYSNEVNDIDKLKELEKFHIWNIDYVKMRFNYNPKKPLYLLLVRAYKLNEPIEIFNRPEWSGCKSWIQFDIEKDEALENNFINNPSQYLEYLKSISNPCIDDAAFDSITLEVRNILK